jgi:hypothetical protein
MRGKILFVAGLAVGYVLGTKAGREKYEELRGTAMKLWNDPRVQKQVDAAQDFVKDKAPEVAEFVSDGAKKVVSQVQGKPAPKPRTSPSSAGGTGGAATKPSTPKS